MTDKQIIIDVTQCPYYREGKFCVRLSYKTKCEGDCDWTSYKEMEEQLKRKEQECEKAKQNAQDTYDLWQALIESFNILQGEKIKLEQECEELKKYEYHYLDKFLKLKDCLTEIKEIIHFNKTNRLSGGACISIEQILQKISECEGKDENN